MCSAHVGLTIKFNRFNLFFSVHSYNLKQKTEMKSADKFNNFSIYGVFLITLTNFLISAFSGANMSPSGSISEVDSSNNMMESMEQPTQFL